MCKRFFDLILSILFLIVLMPLLVIVVMIIKISDPGPVLYWSKRVGKENSYFLMPKFRTMKVNTPQLATHLLENPDKYLIRFGKFFRKTSLDELPQLFSIFWGDMSFVGPRPALFNQEDLIKLRTDKGIHKLLPGLTGWAQINGRDELPIPVKVEFDYNYLVNQSFVLDLKILFRTFLKVITREDITH